MGGVVKADDILRSSGAGPLNLTTAWDGGEVPGAGDVAVWDSGANGGTTTLGADLSWMGIRVLDASFVANGGTNVLTLGAGGIDMSAATVDATFNFNYSLAAAQTWEVASGRTLFVNNAAISGGASEMLTLHGPGTIVFSSATDQTYSGGTMIRGGATVAIGNNNGGGNFGTGTVTLQDNNTLVGHSSGGRTLNTLTAFAGAANTLTLGSLSTPSQFTISGGVDFGTAQRTISLVNPDTATTSNLALRLGGVASGGSGGSLVLSNGNPTPASQEAWVLLGVSAAAELDFDGSLVIGENVQAYFRSSNNLGDGTELTVNGVLDVSNKVTSAINPTIKSLSGTGAVLANRSNGSTNTLTIDGGVTTGTTTFSGIVANGVSPLAITKAGSTTQILSGNNTYTGVTTVNAGTLLINGNQSSATGNVTIAFGATLGGTGTIGGTTTVNGTLAAGTSPGTLTFSQGLNINDGATYAFEGGDLVIVNGQLDLNDNWTLALGSGFADGGSTVIFSYGSLAGSPDLTPTFDISGLGFSPSGPLSLFDDTINNQIVLLGVSAIPEPGTSLLVGFGLVGILYGFRRRA